jgi:hypothetical protein
MLKSLMSDIGLFPKLLNDYVLIDFCLCSGSVRSEVDSSKEVP